MRALKLRLINVEIIVNKSVWIHCFGNDVPDSETLSEDISLLQKRLSQLGDVDSISKKKVYSRLHNRLRRQQKMLAAVKDGQPWAWMLYPSADELNAA